MTSEKNRRRLGILVAVGLAGYGLVGCSASPEGAPAPGALAPGAPAIARVLRGRAEALGQGEPRGQRGAGRERPARLARVAAAPAERRGPAGRRQAARAPAAAAAAATPDAAGRVAAAWAPAAAATPDAAGRAVAARAPAAAAPVAVAVAARRAAVAAAARRAAAAARPAADRHRRQRHRHRRLRYVPEGPDQGFGCRDYGRVVLCDLPAVHPEPAPGESQNSRLSRCERQVPQRGRQRTEHELHRDHGVDRGHAGRRHRQVGHHGRRRHRLPQWRVLPHVHEHVQDAARQDGHRRRDRRSSTRAIRNPEPLRDRTPP